MGPGQQGSARPPLETVRSEPIQVDMYDSLPPDRGTELRRKNKERLAELERRGDERRGRIARITTLSAAPPRAHRTRRAA